MMTMVMQLRMGSCINKFLYTTKGPTYKRRNKTNCNRKPFMPVLQILRACQYLHPQEDRNDPIRKEYSNLEVATTRHQKPTINSSIKNIQPSPSLNPTKKQAIALATEKRLPKQRPLQQCDANKDEPEQQCGRIKGGKEEQPCQEKN